MRPGLGFRPRLPLRREAIVGSDQSVVVIAPPNSPEVEVAVGTFASTPVQEAVTTTPSWQLDVMVNPAMQPDSGDEMGDTQPKAVNTVGDVFPSDNTPSLPDSEPEETLSVRC